MQVLFVCNGNVARSQEAEAFFNSFKKNSDDIAISGGVNVKMGKPIDPLVINVMNEEDYDLSSAQRKFVDEDMVVSSDVIVSFKPKDELPSFVASSTNVRYWNVDDPQHQPIEFHRRVRDEVKEKVVSLVNELSS